MNILHVSAECYPVAKAGGLADVVGALPAYLNQAGQQCSVVMPKYDKPWIATHLLERVHSSRVLFGDKPLSYNIYKEVNSTLGFDLFFVDIPGLLDRTGIYTDPESGYGYWDEFERFFAFQLATVDWVNSWYVRPDIIHCHDHHTGLIPFMLKHVYSYQNMRKIPTVLTIHNGQYHGSFDAGKDFFVPEFDRLQTGLMHWEGRINQLASAIKCAWQVTTVSPTYTEELKHQARGLEPLIQQEAFKIQGILNGIDTQVWDPEKDPMLVENYNLKTFASGKKANKQYLCERFGLNPEQPLFAFIGRLVDEKGADLLPDAIGRMMALREDFTFLLLGTGEPALEERFGAMNVSSGDRFEAVLAYDEELAHRMYAGADALLMPSKVEPCGLNQLYALRYGTIPVVRRVGGLNDTVVDFSLKGGTGVHFDYFDSGAVMDAMHRTLTLLSHPKESQSLIKRAMKQDYSWQKSADAYINLYNKLHQISN